MVLLVVSAPILASVLDDDRLLAGLLIAAAAVPSYAIFATIGGVLNGRRDFVRQARMNAIYATARVICVIGLALVVRPRRRPRRVRARTRRRRGLPAGRPAPRPGQGHLRLAPAGAASRCPASASRWR